MKYLMVIVLAVLISGCENMKAEPTERWEEICYKGNLYITMSHYDTYAITNLLDEHGMPVPCDGKTFCDKIKEMETE